MENANHVLLLQEELQWMAWKKLLAFEKYVTAILSFALVVMHL